MFALVEGRKVGLGVSLEGGGCCGSKMHCMQSQSDMPEANAAVHYLQSQSIMHEVNTAVRCAYPVLQTLGEGML